MSNEELVRCIQAGNNVKDCMIQLWKQNLGLVNVLVRKYGTKAEQEDLFQEAFFALHKAAMKYDSDYNTCFSTYAVYWIRFYIVRYMQNNVSLIRVPVHVRDAIIHYKKVVDDFESKHARKPTEEEVAVIMKNGVAIAHKEQEISQVNYIHSLSELIGEESDTSLESLIPSDTDIENEALRDYDREKMQILLWDIVEQLPKRDSEIVKMRLKDNMTMKEIGGRVGVSEQRISRILGNVRRKIRMSPSNIGLREYYAQYLK